MNLLCRAMCVTVGVGVVSQAWAADLSGASVIRQMHAKYQNAWFETTQFAQKTTKYGAGGESTVEMWYERIQLPGKLRIDIGSSTDGNAMVLTNGRMYTFKQGTMVDSHPTVSLALLLGFDVYRQSPDATLAQLKGEELDLGEVHEESWEGRPVYVVGAQAGDLKSRQVWIDKERLLALRIMVPPQQQTAPTSDIRFLDFQKQTRGFIAARIDVYRAGKLVMSEEYSDIKSDIPLSAEWFDPSKLRYPR